MALVAMSAGISPPVAKAELPAWAPFSAQKFQQTPVDEMPAPSVEDLTPEEKATVRVFIENTPSVVNISNNVVTRKYVIRAFHFAAPLAAYLKSEECRMYRMYRLAFTMSPRLFYFFP